MVSAGNPKQWGDDYPSEELLLSDIYNNVSYIIEADGEAIATFVLMHGIEPTYRKIYEGKWIDDSLPYATIHRIASREGVHGVLAFVIDWAQSQTNNIKIDTHRDNRPMQHLLQKNGFSYCGIIYLDDGDERLAYQLINY